MLVLTGVRADGALEPTAMSDGCRESADPWIDLLRDCRSRGLRAPVLAVGDGAPGSWKALAEAFAEARHRRRWVHRTATPLNALPGSARPGAGKALREICNAKDREHALKAVAAFGKT
ncbi:transposase [Streptomyces desertarenae]|uniref:Mutator family transposase n=1 Tax=Streptomyces desertarenae TaxID=2666184 RepID=A0ABW4PR03_9ACTN